MQTLEKIQNLFSEYEILACQDLSLSSSTHYHIYKFLETNYREEYLSTQRLVFYSDKTPDKDLLIHLQEACQHFDISNWFVLVMCPGDLQDLLNEIRVKHSIDEISITHVPISIEGGKLYSPAKFQLPNTMCAMPWVAVEISVNGDLRPCCVFDNKDLVDKNGSKYNINTHTIQEFYKSNSMADLRQQLKQGIRSPGCQSCWKKEDNRMKSTRQFYMVHHKRDVMTHDFDDIGMHRVTSLDLDCGNLCNLKCNICSYHRSSSIAAELIQTADDDLKKKNVKIIKSWNQASRWIDDINKWNQIFDHTENLKYLEFEGGEPLFHDLHSHALKKVISQGYAPNIRLRYSTNGTIWPQDLLPLWKEFKEVNLQFSIDDIKDRFEYQRTNAKWQDVFENLSKFNSLKQTNLTFAIFCTVNIQNIFYLPELVVEFEKFGWPIHFNQLQNSPPDISIGLTEQARNLIVDKIENFLVSRPDLSDQFSMILFAVKNSQVSDGIRFVEWIKNLDLLRNRRFDQVHPEIAKAMGY